MRGVIIGWHKTGHMKKNGKVHIIMTCVYAVEQAAIRLHQFET